MYFNQKWNKIGGHCNEESSKHRQNNRNTICKILHDPQFRITVNHRTLNLEDLTGETEPAEIDIDGTNIHLTAYFVDTTKAGRKSIFQGIAFWQSGRLVGEPS